MLTYAGLLVPVALVDAAGNAQGRQVVDVLNLDGTGATVYTDAARTPLTGSVASDPTGNVSGVYAEPGMYRLRFSVLGVSYEVLTVAPVDPREVDELGVSTDGRLDALEQGSVPLTQKGVANGVASLDSGGHVPDTQIPAGIARDAEVTTAVNAAVAALVAGAPGALDTLNELAAQLGSDENAAAALTTAVTRLTLTATATKTAAYTAAPGDLVPVSTAGGPVTITLPAAPTTGTRVAVKHTVQGGTNTVTIAAGGTDHFNTSTGPTTATLTLLNQAVQLLYSGGVWLVVADDLPLSQLDGRFLTPSGAAGAYAPIDPTVVTASGSAVNDTAAIASALTSMTTAGKLSGTLRLKGNIGLSAALVIDGGYSDVTNDANANAGAGEVFRLICEGSITPAVGLARAVTIKGLYEPYIDVRFKGGGDQATFADGAMTASGTTLTVPSAAFTSAWVGRKVRVAGAGTYGVPIVGCVVSVTDATHVVLDRQAETTVSGAAVISWSVALHAENIVGSNGQVHATGYAGVVLHSDAIGDTTKRIRRCSWQRVYTDQCGQGVSWVALEDGNALVDVWDNNNYEGMYFGFCSDVSITRVENFSPTTQTAGMFFEGCNSFDVGTLSLGDRPAEAQCKIQGQTALNGVVTATDFGGVGRIECRGFASGTPARNGLKLIDVSTIEIDSLQTFRTAKGLWIQGGTKKITVKKHLSLTTDVNPLMIEGGNASSSPNIELGVDYRFCSERAVRVQGVGGTLRLTGWIDTPNTGLTAGLYAIDVASSAFGVKVNRDNLQVTGTTNVVGVITHPRPGNISGGYLRERQDAVWTVDPRACNTAAYTVAGQTRAGRIVVPVDGTITNIAFWAGTRSGNFDLGIYDTDGTTHTRLWNLGSTAMTGLAADNAWYTYQPNLKVSAGDQLDLALWIDNTTATVLRQAGGNWTVLPTGFHAAPGQASPRLAWAISAASLTTTITDASLSPGGVIPCLVVTIA